MAKHPKSMTITRRIVCNNQTKGYVLKDAKGVETAALLYSIVYKVRFNDWILTNATADCNSEGALIIRGTNNSLDNLPVISLPETHPFLYRCVLGIKPLSEIRAKTKRKEPQSSWTN